ncbi:MAG: hypothetical protein K1X88_18250 [Nannocystaceae bacterium]|nr:hypothetical protein [Nannocystaceae bacterium]
MFSLPVIDGLKFVFELHPTGQSARLRCPRCAEVTTQRRVAPEAGATAAADEPMWQCERCSKIAIAVPMARRLVGLVLLGMFACVSLGALGASLWFLGELVIAAPDGAVGVGVALALGAVGVGYIALRILRAMRGLLRRDAMVPMSYDAARRRWIVQGQL